MNNRNKVTARVAIDEDFNHLVEFLSLRWNLGVLFYPWMACVKKLKNQARVEKIKQLLRFAMFKKSWVVMVSEVILAGEDQVRFHSVYTSPEFLLIVIDSHWQRCNLGKER